MYMAGITDPLAMPSLHHLLDVTEMVIVESMGSSNEIQRFYYRTYKPDPAEIQVASFSVEEQSASFDAFTQALGSMH
jgi:hypothetical protein